MRPARGGLVVEGAVDALEPAPNRFARRAVRKHVETVGKNRVCSQAGHVVDVEHRVVFRRGRQLLDGLVPPSEAGP